MKTTEDGTVLRKEKLRKNIMNSLYTQMSILIYNEEKMQYGQTKSISNNETYLEIYFFYQILSYLPI